MLDSITYVIGSGSGSETPAPEPEEKTDAEKIELDLSALSIVNTLAIGTDSISLPETGTNGSTITWTSSNTDVIGNDGRIVVRPVGENVTVTFTATLTLGEENREQTIDVEIIATADSSASDTGTTTTYTFANYTAGEQYAENEEHVLDGNTTVTTTQAHFTTELRLYSSTTNNGFAIIKSEKVITGFAFNAGNKADTLNVYGSTDGEEWTLIEGVAVTSSYKDYTLTVDFEGENYTYLKLDVKGTNQVRLKSITLTYKNN